MTVKSSWGNRACHHSGQEFYETNHQHLHYLFLDDVPSSDSTAGLLKPVELVESLSFSSAAARPRVGDQSGSEITGHRGKHGRT